MIIAVVSDTHRKLGSINKVKNKLEDVDMLIHLGDNVDDVEELKCSFNGKILNVKGNCDFSRAPIEILETIEGKRFFITHGHKYDVKYNLMKLRYKALENNVDVVLFGHTHVPYIEYEEDIWYINPGSAAQSRGKFNSIVKIQIDNNGIKPEIIEL